MPKPKNIEGMAHILNALKKNRKASYSDIRTAAEKKRLKVYPIMFGRAQALLGIVKSAPRGQGKQAKARAAKSAGMLPRRGPGRPRKYPLPMTGAVGLDSILAAVRGSQQQLGRFRAALERIQSVVADSLQ